MKDPKKVLATMLEWRQYRYETTEEILKFAVDNNLVIVYGASDDLCELEWAITDEIWCYMGGEVYFMDWEILENECGDNRPYYEQIKQRAFEIEIGDFSQGKGHYYNTDIPHEIFNIYEDEEIYCKGIVFSIEDIK